MHAPIVPATPALQCCAPRNWQCRRRQALRPANCPARAAGETGRPAAAGALLVPGCRCGRHAVPPHCPRAAATLNPKPSGSSPRPPPPAELRSLAGEDRDDVVVDVLLRDLVPVRHLQLHRQALRAATTGVSASRNPKPYIATPAAQNVGSLKSPTGHQKNSKQMLEC